jgi:acyl-CoA dehydrogenase
VALTAPAGAELEDRIEAYAREVIRPRAAAMARGEGDGGRELVAAAAERGLCSLTVPEKYGGAGAGHVAFARFIEAVARECASSAVILDVQGSVACEPLLRFGTEEQRQRLLPRLTSGEWVGAFCLSEAGSGSDAAALQTRADRIGGGYRLTGAKMWITNCGVADLYIVMARTGDRGARGITAFCVAASTPGVRPGRPLHKLGLRGSRTAELVLDSVEVPEVDRLGKEGQGFRIAMSALDSGRIGISAQAVGLAQGALDAAVAHVAGLGVAPIDDAALVDEAAANCAPAVTAPLADMAARVAMARAVTLEAAALVDTGEVPTRAAAIAKLISTDACVEVAHAAVELCAPHSSDETHPAAIRLRDAKACQIYEGTNQIQRIVIARELLR